MPYKREGSPFYYVRRRKLPGFGDTGRMSSGSTSKAVAHRMEQTLDDIGQRALLDPSWLHLLEALCRQKRLSLHDLLLARSQGRLDALRRSLNDPLLTEAVAAFKAVREPKREVKIGLDQLLGYAPAGVRLSYLTGQTITLLCHRAEREGRKRNSVRRYLLRAISHLLRHHLGKAERERLFADVEYSAAADTREVNLTPAEIARLLQAADDLGYPELGTVIRMALVTSADRGVLLSGRAHHGRQCRGLLKQDIQIWQENESGAFTGEVFLFDTKTETRSRTVPITDLMCRELLALAGGKAPDEPVFSFRYMDLDYPWKRIKKAASLEHLRFKDLRAQMSQYGEEAGVPLTILSRTMGHSQERMTQRYQQRAAVMSTGQMEAIEAAMFQGPEKKLKLAK